MGTKLKLLIITIIFLASYKVANAAITIRPMLNTGLVGYWSMDEGAGNKSYDHSGNGHAGTIYSAYTDDFNRGDSGDLGANWGILAAYARHEIVGNRAEVTGVATTIDLYQSALNRPQYAQVRIYNEPVNWNDYIGVGVLGTTAGDGYMFQTLGGSTIGVIRKLTAGSYANMGSSFTIPDIIKEGGTVMRLEAYENGDLVAFVDGVAVATRNDSDWTTGAGFIKGYNDAGQFDDFEFGSLPDTIWTDGKLGKALDFDGVNDYVDCGSDSQLAPQTFTASAWFKPHNLDQGFVRILQQGPNDGGWGIEWDGPGGEPDASDQPYGVIWNGGSYQRVVASASTTITAETWYLVTLSYDDSTNVAKFYIDGQLVGSRPSTVMTAPASINFNIGRHPSGSNYNNSSIDEARLYNRVLSDAEVQRLYNLTKPKIKAASDSGLVGYWSFEEGAGTKVGDMSGRGNNGIVNGNLSWANGKRGGAMRFPDDAVMQTINVGPSSVLNNLSELSISVWIRPGPNRFGGRIVQKNNDPCCENGAVSGWYFSVTDNGGGIEDALEFNVDYDGAQNLSQRTFNNTIIHEAWQYVTITWNGSSSASGAKIFVNGVPQTQQNTDGVGARVSDVAQSLVIGSNNDDNTDDFKGLIDEVRIYNRALSDTEVAGLYSASKKIIKVNAPQNTKLTNGLVGMWTFNGQDMYTNAGYPVAKCTVNSTYDAAFLNGAALDSGRVGQGVRMDNNDDVIMVGNSADLGEGSALTASAWVRFNNPGDDSTKDIISKYRSGAGWEQWRLLKDRSGATNKLWFDMWDSSDTVASAESDNAWPTDTDWHHVAGVYDGVNIYLYGDGESLDSTANAMTAPIKDYTNIICFGGSWSGGACDGTGAPLDGNLDEVRIYNRALSAGEIKRLYNMGK